MRLFSLFISFHLFATAVLSQESGYLYIESENNQPFYVRSKDSLYVSAPEGFLILAPLKGVKGDLILGFPGQAAAAFVFTIGSTAWEKGLILRDMKKEGWRLYDYREEEMLNIRRLGRAEDRYVGMRKRTDVFALQLSKVVNDTAVLYYRPQAGKTVVAVEKPEAPAPLVRLISERETSTAWLYIYEILEEGKPEQVAVEIPKDKKDGLYE